MRSVGDRRVQLEDARSTDISPSLALPQGQEVPQNVAPERRGRRSPECRVQVIPVYRDLDPVAANKGDRGQVDGAIRYRVSTTDALPTSGYTPTKAE